LAGLDIAEKRVPQDGRCDYTLKDKVFNMRVSVLPTVHGQKVVMRILDKMNFLIPKERLGFTPQNLEKFEQLLMNPHGIILITGPTGSGKSTTLYTMLNELNQIYDNITTVEDPVEYLIDGLNQVQVNTKAGLSFAGALRAFLRQDPDIIMLGEIRDAETVDVALRAAITGHLVLSTLHTNDAISSISRLIDMGVPPYMIAVALMGVISQRLLRRLCSHCSAPYVPAEHEIKYLGLPQGSYTFKRPKGCSFCNNSGYKGRIAVHEILLINKGHRDLIAQNAPINEIFDYSLSTGMTTLKQECIRLLTEGITSFDEVMEITYTQEYAMV
jgi:type IV pilus assembly protein PilB